MTDIVEQQNATLKKDIANAEAALQDSASLKEASVHVNVEMEQLRLARVDEDFTRTELEKVQEERDTFLQQTVQGRHILQKQENLINAKDLAKTVTKTRYDHVRDTLLSRAKAMLSKGGSPWGRGFHANVQVQKGVELNILDMVKAVTWLQLVGMEEIVNIPLRNNTGFFRNAKPPAGSLELLTVPTIKIDKDISPVTVVLTGSVESSSSDEDKADVAPIPDGHVEEVDIDLAKLETDLAQTLAVSAGGSVKAAPGISLSPPATRSETEEAEKAAVRKTLGGGTTRRVD